MITEFLIKCRQTQCSTSFEKKCSLSLKLIFYVALIFIYFFQRECTTCAHSITASNIFQIDSLTFEIVVSRLCLFDFVKSSEKSYFDLCLNPLWQDHIWSLVAEWFLINEAVHIYMW